MPVSTGSARKVSNSLRVALLIGLLFLDCHRSIVAMIQQPLDSWLCYFALPVDQYFFTDSARRTMYTTLPLPNDLH
jgi:hypothetical protein